MYRSKKIGVFISHIMGHYQKNVCQGIIDKALEYGYTAEVYASLDGENLGSYGRGEENILQIPNYERLSGVIFASDTYPQPELKQKIYQILKEKCSCPIMEITAAETQFPSVSLDNNYATLQLTKHLINTHSCKRICYLGCSEEAFFSDAREGYYRQAMVDAELPISASDIYTASYTRESVESALSLFTENNTKPDAVICYNDRLALLFMQAALEKGHRIPQDFAITGCDHSDEGQNAVPALTTVSFPAYELGICATENLLKLIHKESLPEKTTITAQIIQSASCGCMDAIAHNSLSFSQSLSERIGSLESSILSSMRMSAALQGISDIDDAMDLLESYIQEIEHCKEFYLCLYSDWDSLSHQILELTSSEEEYTTSDEVLLKLAIRDGRRLPEYSFSGTSLLPEHIYKQSNSSYLFMPLYFEERNFGYIALAYEKNRMDFHFRLVHWFMNINQLLERICENKKSSLLYSHLEDSYIKDALTGLYNQQGYRQQEELLLKQARLEGSTLTGFVFDLDKLKYINDTFGYHEGDFAIQVIGHTLSSMIRPTDICARLHGDKFHLLSKDYTKEDAEELINRVRKYLSNYNKLSNKEYSISTSIGFAQASAAEIADSEQLTELFSLANMHMLKQKES